MLKRVRYKSNNWLTEEGVVYYVNQYNHNVQDVEKALGLKAVQIASGRLVAVHELIDEGKFEEALTELRRIQLIGW
jgi:hypothetical protein